MPTIKTQAVILKKTDWRDNDRILTLLSPSHGRMEALCRGCRRTKSPLLAASENFALGEYVLFSSNGRLTVTGCMLADSFYPLRQDYDLLKYASYILSVSEIVSRDGEPALELFTLLTRSLSRLAYKNMEPRSVTGAFLLLLAALEGWRPRLSHCVLCGKSFEPAGLPLFSIAEGGAVCRSCPRPLTGVIPVSPREIIWMKDVLLVGIEKTACPPEDTPLRLLMSYIESRLERRPPAAKLIP
ncbi:MAG: DNA repair protein RecO [Clostridia bacterium]|nr:DNA repair protein RecO [Clostridia bacterium]